MGKSMSELRRASSASSTCDELNFAPGIDQYQPSVIGPSNPFSIQSPIVLGPCFPPCEPSMLRSLKPPGPTFFRSSVVDVVAGAPRRGELRLGVDDREG